MSLGSPSALAVLPITGRDLALADSANYFVGSTPTPGTGIISGTPITLVETTPLLVVFNAGLLNVYLTYLRIGTTVASTGDVTFLNFTHSVDQGNRMGTATNGTALTINNTNVMSNVKSGVQATYGAITGAAAKTANARLLGNDWFRGNFINIIGDVYEWQFGAPAGVGVGSTPATVINCVRSAPAIVLQPQSSYILNCWAITTFTTGFTAEVQLGFAEK
jgi:hypothetical protein